MPNSNKSVVFKYADRCFNQHAAVHRNRFPLACPADQQKQGCADIPGLLASLRQVGDSMCSRASAASMVLSGQCTLLPWTDASTAGGHTET